MAASSPSVELNIWIFKLKLVNLFLVTCKTSLKQRKRVKSLLKLSFSSFYPHILIASSVCLFITLMIYTIFPKLLNHYTRLMRHYTLSMMCAFILLSINQLTYLGSFSPNLCKVSGEISTLEVVGI